MGQLLAKAAFDYRELRKILEDAFQGAEKDFNEGTCPKLDNEIEDALDILFNSKTQAHREVLIGCVLVSIYDKNIDIRKPYKGQATNAYNGRTLDEQVVNPFLKDRRIPSSSAPFLSAYRRSVDFSPATRAGIRDKKAFDALLTLIDFLEKSNKNHRVEFLKALLCWFLRLREQSNIPLAKLNRVSATQYNRLLEDLLKVPSGGRIPVIIAVAMLHAIRSHFKLAWHIDYQGINEADAAGGAGGDITVTAEGKAIFIAEVTERVVDKARVVSTFNRKISPAAIHDYIFFAAATPDAKTQAIQYFAQGSEVNFVDILNWASVTLITIGAEGRDAFNSQILEMLAADDVPRNIKMAWNDLVANLTSV